MTRWLRVLGVVFALGLVLTACGDDGGGDDAAGEGDGGGGGSGTGVTIVDFAFDPGELTVSAGDTVTWINDGGTAHTVTSDDEAFDSGNVDGGGTFEQTFDEAGSFAYHCAIHGQMTGTITVE